jgi:hypothetical protein
MIREPDDSLTHGSTGRWSAARRVAGPVAGIGVFHAMRADDRTPPVHLTNEQDRQRLMELLKINSLRAGAEWLQQANCDESKANPYPTLPDSVTLKNGRKVTKASDWWSKRRPDIVEDFDREAYGRVPKNVPKVKWVVEKTSLVLASTMAWLMEWGCAGCSIARFAGTVCPNISARTTALRPIWQFAIDRWAFHRFETGAVAVNVFFL